ncbi:MAG: amidohydrolase family protein [Dysosmobacter welbionis]
MESGACGICFLELIPGVSSKELFEITKVAKAYHKPVTIHLRKDGREALETLDEIFELAAKTEASIHLLELMYMVGMAGTMPKALELIDQARRSGLDITADSGVYDAYTVCIERAFLIRAGRGTGKSYQDLVISSGIHLGETCSEPLFRHLRENSPSTLITAFVGDSDAVAMALQKDYVYVSTNASDGPCYPMAGSPEMAGTYPRLIGRFVREQGELSLMEAIRKITILPALRFGLKDIGSLEMGKNADMVIFDYDTIMDGRLCDAGKPRRGSGRDILVIVNGHVVVRMERSCQRIHGLYIKV